MNAIRRLTAKAINRMIQRYVDDEHTEAGKTLYRAGMCGAGYYTPIHHSRRDPTYLFFKNLMQCERWQEIMKNDPTKTSRGVCVGVGEKEFCDHCFSLPQNCICEANDE